MNRSGYSDDFEDQWQNIMWRGAVNSAIKGSRGQQFLRDLLGSLDAMPEKRLVAGDLENSGSFCALGVAGHAKGLSLANIDTYDAESLGATFNIAEAMAREIMFINDEAITEHEWVNSGEAYPNHRKRVEVANAQERRWEIVREWVVKNIKN